MPSINRINFSSTQSKLEYPDFLDIQLKDNVKARIVDAGHNNHYKMGEKGKQFRSQKMLYQYYQNKLLRKTNQ